MTAPKPDLAEIRERWAGWTVEQGRDAPVLLAYIEAIEAEHKATVERLEERASLAEADLDGRGRAGCDFCAAVPTTSIPVCHNCFDDHHELRKRLAERDAECARLREAQKTCFDGQAGCALSPPASPPQAEAPVCQCYISDVCPVHPDDEPQWAEAPERVTLHGGTTLHWFQQPVDYLRADLADEAVRLLRETRIYALGSDCSTVALIERVDYFLARLDAGSKAK